MKKAVSDFLRKHDTFEEKNLLVLSAFLDVSFFVTLIMDIAFYEKGLFAEVLVSGVLVILIPVCVSVAYRKKKIQLYSTILVAFVLFFVQPVVFFHNDGGIGSGVPDMIIAFLMIGLCSFGIWKIIFAISAVLITGAEYFVWYNYPEFIVSHPREQYIIVSGLSLIYAGIAVLVLTSFLVRLFKKENDKAKDEAERAEELNKSQSRFFSSMSHEIRTPINSILGLNELILRREEVDEKTKRDAKNIQGAGKMLLALVNDILDVSKINAGKMDIVPVNYKPAELVSEIVNMIWLRAEEKGLRFEVSVDPSIPSELFGDEVRIRQILINLLNNAVKYTKEGTIRLHLESAEVTDDSVRLIMEVSDTGMGIKPEAIPVLFDSFSRVDEEKNRNIEGTGLGLSIVKQLVELMDGRITVDSVYSQGSTFTVELTQGISNHHIIGEVNIANTDTTGSGHAYESGFTAQQARILIVDDNELNLSVEKGLLSETKMTIDTVLSGEKALELTLVNRYDVILMDHLMPNMDGIECLKRIRNQSGGLNNQVPVIVLTANAGSENLELYRNSGFDGYLAKPVSGKQMEEVLLHHIPVKKVTKIRSDLENREMNATKGYSRKIPLYITASTMCDLPDEIVKKLPIEIIPFTLWTKNGMFWDGVDAGSDELVRYMKNEDNVLKSGPPTAEEFEKLFSRVTAKAHQIIHITLTTGMSKEYEVAVSVAKKFGNVRVVNSEYLSSAYGLLVFLAGIMAAHNEPVERILSELEYLKKTMHCSFIVSDLEYMRRGGHVSSTTEMMMKSMSMRPSLRLKNNKFGVDKLWVGNLRKSYERYIHHALPRSADPDLNVLFITYVDVSEEDLQWIEKEVRKIAAFNFVIFQKASAAVSVNCGPGTFGLLYMDKGRRAWHMEPYLSSFAQTDTEQDEPVASYTVPADNKEDEIVYEERADAGEIEENEPLWYESIPGIDPETAIKNSGSEDAFKTVLQIFYDSIDSKSSEIEGYYREGDWKNYTIKVHALKSSAKIIGALSLSDKAKELEDAGKESDIDYIRNNHEEMMEEYRSYKEKLSFVFNSDEKEADDERPLADKTLIESVYDTIREACDSMDTDAIDETFSELSAYRIPEDEAEKINRLKECFDNFDYDGMLSILEGKNG